MQYRIKVEVIGEQEHKISAALQEGIECEGFAIIADKGETRAKIIHGVSNIELASAIAGSDELMAASIIAKALREAKEVSDKGKIKEISGLLNLLHS